MTAHTGRKISTGMTHSGIFLRVERRLHVRRHRGLRLGRLGGDGRGLLGRRGRGGGLDGCAGARLVGGSGRGRRGIAAVAAIATTEPEGGSAVLGALEQVLGNFGHSSSEGVGRVKREPVGTERLERRST